MEITSITKPSESDVGMVEFVVNRSFTNEEFNEVLKIIDLYGYSNGIKVTSYEEGVLYALEPKFPQEVNDYIEDYGDKIFHVSPSKFEEKILKKGLITRDSLSRFHFKGRVYLFSSTLPKLHNEPDKIRKMIQKNVVNMLKTDPSKGETEWCVYEIDGSGLNFHHDQFVQNPVYFSFFTLGNIHPSRIKKVGEIHV